MTLPEFQSLVANIAAPVILLEGTRDLPETDAGRLTDFARWLAATFPRALFRTGNASGNFAPANVGLFYVRTANPLQGGTGHTIRVCQAHAVPVAFQADWLHWPRSRSRLRSPPCSRAAPLSAACG